MSSKAYRGLCCIYNVAVLTFFGQWVLLMKHTGLSTSRTLKPGLLFEQFKQLVSSPPCTQSSLPSHFRLIGITCTHKIPYPYYIHVHTYHVMVSIGHIQRRIEYKLNFIFMQYINYSDFFLSVYNSCKIPVLSAHENYKDVKICL